MRVGVKDKDAATDARAFVVGVELDLDLVLLILM